MGVVEVVVVVGVVGVVGVVEVVVVVGVVVIVVIVVYPLAIASHALEWFDHWNNHCRDWRFFVGVLFGDLTRLLLIDTHLYYFVSLNVLGIAGDAKSTKQTGSS